MSSESASPIVYFLEVSGWDIGEDFFVEQTQLEWCTGVGERLLIHRAVGVGSVVFLRLVNPTDLGPAFPVAYQVEAARKQPSSGLWDLRLTQLRARSKDRQETGPEAEEVLEEQHR